MINVQRYWADGDLYEITDGTSKKSDVVLASDFDNETSRLSDELEKEWLFRVSLVEQWTQEKKDLEVAVNSWGEVAEQLQTDLEQAWELLRDIQNNTFDTLLYARINSILPNQSAPANKGQGEPVAIGTLRRDANEQIVFDAVGDPYIKDGMLVYCKQP